MHVGRLVAAAGAGAAAAWGVRLLLAERVPMRVEAVWVDTVLTKAEQKPLRGFGGRLYFFGPNNSQEPVKVEGPRGLTAEPHAPAGAPGFLRRGSDHRPGGAHAGRPRRVPAWARGAGAKAKPWGGGGLAPAGRPAWRRAKRGSAAFL